MQKNFGNPKFGQNYKQNFLGHKNSMMQNDTKTQKNFGDIDFGQGYKPSNLKNSYSSNFFTPSKKTTLLSKKNLEQLSEIMAMEELEKMMLKSKLETNPPPSSKKNVDKKFESNSNNDIQVKKNVKNTASSSKNSALKDFTLNTIDTGMAWKENPKNTGKMSAIKTVIALGKNIDKTMSKNNSTQDAVTNVIANTATDLIVDKAISVVTKSNPIVSTALNVCDFVNEHGEKIVKSCEKITEKFSEKNKEYQKEIGTSDNSIDNNLRDGANEVEALAIGGKYVVKGAVKALSSVAKGVNLVKENVVAPVLNGEYEKKIEEYKKNDIGNSDNPVDDDLRDGANELEAFTKLISVPIKGVNTIINKCSKPTVKFFNEVGEKMTEQAEMEAKDAENDFKALVKGVDLCKDATKKTGKVLGKFFNELGKEMVEQEKMEGCNYE